MPPRPALMMSTTALAFVAVGFLVASGCDLNRRSPRAPDEGASLSDDGGERERGSADGGSNTPPGPTFTAQPGDIQI